MTLWQSIKSLPSRAWAQMLTPDGRRALTFLALRVAGFILTAYAVAALWLVRNVAEYAFGLGLAAMGLIAIILTGDVALFVKRSLKLSRDGIEMNDQPDAPIQSGDIVTVEKV